MRTGLNSEPTLAYTPREVAQKPRQTMDELAPSTDLILNRWPGKLESTKGSASTEVGAKNYYFTS